MKTIFAQILACVGVVSFSGCISYTGVKRVEPGTNPKGLRVKLPAPFVVGKPDPSGTIVYNVEYLPDPDQEYAINAWALMAKNHTDIERTMSLLLKKATVTQDTTAVAKELIGQGGAVGLEALKVHQKAEADAVAAKQAQQTAAAASLATAHATLATARETLRTKAQAVEKLRIELGPKAHDLAVANKELDAAQKSRKDATTPEEITKAEAALKTATATQVAATQQFKLKDQEFNIAQEERDIAQRELTDALAAVSKADTRNLDAVKAPEAPLKAKVAAPGMVIYRIVEAKDGSGITLEQMRFKLFSMNGRRLIHNAGQLNHPTWGVKPPPK